MADASTVEKSRAGGDFGAEKGGEATGVDGGVLVAILLGLAEFVDVVSDVFETAGKGGS